MGEKLLYNTVASRTLRTQDAPAPVKFPVPLVPILTESPGLAGLSLPGYDHCPDRKLRPTQHRMRPRHSSVAHMTFYRIIPV
uniref:Uncharacterized protein n=1 Tax=Magallana gigas TaxID=29159 RepID=K1Q7H5_MAGGI